MDFDHAPNMRGHAAEPQDVNHNHTAGSNYDPEDSEYLEVASHAGSSSEASDASDGSRSVKWSSPSKRQAEPHAGEAPAKRRKRGFNHDYMNLLNADIEDAANQLVMEPPPPNTPRLHQTQVGLTIWTPLEKELFFEAVGRLGQDDLRGISSRIRTKSEVEVRQYLQLFDDTLRTRQDDLHLRWEDVLQMADYPAAVELSEGCCDALDEAADDLAARVERHEQKLEQRKWGSECWVIDAQRAKELDNDKDSAQKKQSRLAFARLFHLQAWLKLPEQMFMNSAVPGENWQSLEEEEEEEEELPKMRATALEDFHSLAVSVTRKIVLSSLYVAESRIRAKKAVKPNTKDLVKTKDVEAAVASLKLKSDGQRYWATAARRLGLHVYDGPLPEEDSEDSDDEGSNGEQQGPLSYDDVEAQLIPETPAQMRRREKLTRQPSTKTQIMEFIDFELSDRESSSSSESAPDDEDDDPDPAYSTDGGGRDAGALDKSKADMGEDVAVRSEAREVLTYSAHEFPQTERAKEALVSRIRLEREQEAYADAVDARAGREEETKMWRLLRAPVPPVAAEPDFVVKMQGKEVKRPRQSVVGLEEMHDYGLRWRERLEYASEWETLGHMEPRHRE